jgi:hypothetical protein
VVGAVGVAAGTVRAVGTVNGRSRSDWGGKGSRVVMEVGGEVGEVEGAGRVGMEAMGHVGVVVAVVVG